MIDIKVFIITSQDRNLDPGIKHFVVENRLELIESPGVFLEPGRKSLSTVNLEDCYLRIGREISLQEIGIALAHKQVYRKIIEAKYSWAIVLEDDAIVVDYNFLKVQVERFIELPSDNPRVGLLFHHAKGLIDSCPNSTFIKSKFTPSYAVAYILNNSAARRLMESQTPISSVADWPLCSHQMEYWLSKSFAIRHGSETNQYSSYLEGVNRSPAKFLYKWRWILGFDLVRLNRLSFTALHRHYCFVIKPRISFSKF